MALYLDCWSAHPTLRASYAEHSFEGLGDFPAAFLASRGYRFEGLANPEHMVKTPLSDAWCIPRRGGIASRIDRTTNLENLNRN